MTHGEGPPFPVSSHPCPHPFPFVSHPKVPLMCDQVFCLNDHGTSSSKGSQGILEYGYLNEVGLLGRPHLPIFFGMK